jgi:hypothetical protein
VRRRRPVALRGRFSFFAHRAAQVGLLRQAQGRSFDGLKTGPSVSSGTPTPGEALNHAFPSANLPRRDANEVWRNRTRVSSTRLLPRGRSLRKARRRIGEMWLGLGLGVEAFAVPIWTDPARGEKPTFALLLRNPPRSFAFTTDTRNAGNSAVIGTI